MRSDAQQKPCQALLLDLWCVHADAEVGVALATKVGTKRMQSTRNGRRAASFAEMYSLLKAANNQRLQTLRLIAD